MGLYRRLDSAIWWVSYMAGGHQRRESSHSTNKRVAKNLLAIRQAEIVEGRFRLPKSKPPRFEEWTGQFLDTIQHPNTKRRYTSSVGNLKVHFKGVRLSEITASEIEEFKRARLKSGVGPATVNRDLAVLRRMLKLAERQRLIAQSPFGEVELLEERRGRRQPHILSFEEQGRLLTVAPPHLRALIVLLTETGLRVGKEALQLKWEDVDLANDVIQVRESKTLAGVREMPISGFCKEELLRWRFLAGPDFSPYIFFNALKPSVNLKAVRKVWASALKAARIDYFRIYDLRATFASRLSAAGVPDVFVSQMMGHAGGLLQTYAKAIDRYRRDAIRKLEELRQSQLLGSASQRSGSTVQ